MTVASDEARMRKEKTFMNKLNLILVQVCKYECILTGRDSHYLSDTETGVAS